LLSPGIAGGDPSEPPGGLDALAALPCWKTIVLEFDAAGRYRKEVANTHESDIAVGPSGVFVSTSQPRLRPPQMVYRLGARSATFSYRRPRALGAGVQHSASYMQLDIASNGHVHAVVDRAAPYFRGALTFGDPRGIRGPIEGDQVPLGVTDKPALAGPHHPRRIDAATDIYLLEAPYGRTRTTGLPDTEFSAQDNVGAVQRWSTAQGVPVWQAIHNGNLSTATGLSNTFDSAGPLVDISSDGKNLFLASAEVIWSRPDALPPTWHLRDDAAHYISISADEGKVAALDGANRTVTIVRSDGSRWRTWPLSRPGEKRLAGDLAYDDGRIYLADQGRNRVMVRDERGRDLGEWLTHDGPKRLAVGPEGDVYVLGRGGHGLRYHPDGTLVASWRVPQTHNDVAVDPTDMAVGDDGLVYVSFVGLVERPPQDGPTGRAGYSIAAAGVWVFSQV
jgi:hypothetical protein